MARFPTALRGYERTQVDALMARIDGTLGRAPLMAPPVTPEELSATRFATALRGYDRSAVDRAMSDAATALGGPGPVQPPPAGPRPDAMLARLRNAQFATTTLRPGYDQADVDRFLDRAAAALNGAGAPLTPEEVRAARFATSRLRNGYDEDQVDALLDELIAHLERYGSG